MSMTEDDPKLKFLSIEKAVEPPPGLIEHLKNCWWACHPTKGLIFYYADKRSGGSPQCNNHQEITKELIRRLYPWAECKFVPSVFRRIDPRDYV